MQFDHGRGGERSRRPARGDLVVEELERSSARIEPTRGPAAPRGTAVGTPSFGVVVTVQLTGLVRVFGR